jgi:hypothetical protein
MDQTIFSIHSLNYALAKLKDAIAKASLKIFQLKDRLAIVPVPIAEHGARS